MDLAITGGCGFIGARLKKQLEADDHRCTVIDLNAPTPVNITDHASMLSTVRGDAVYHLAAAHRDDIRPLSIYHDVNVQGTRNVCDAARENGVQTIIFTSSVAVYGFAPPNTGEDGEHNYFNAYGETKSLAEDVVKAWYEEDPENRSLVIVRPTVVFGEGNRGNVYNLLRQLASGAFIMIGDGNNVKSMAYVDNVVAFLQRCLSLGPGLHIYNYIDKPDLDMNTLVRLVRRTLGRKDSVGMRLPFSVGIAAGKAADLVARVSKRSLPISAVRVRKFCATTQLSTKIGETGFTPPYDLQDALERTVRHEFG